MKRPPSRPRSIVWFERLVLLSLVIGIFGAYAHSDRAIAAMSRPDEAPALLITAQAAIVAAILLLLWLVARRHSVAAMWLYVLLVGLRVVAAVVAALATRFTPSAIYSLSIALEVATLVLLFRPDSRRWFRGDWQAVDPDAFS